MLIRVQDAKEYCNDYDWYIYTTFNTIEEFYRHIDWVISQNRDDFNMSNELTLLDYCRFLDEKGDNCVILLNNPKVLQTTDIIFEGEKICY